MSKVWPFLLVNFWAKNNKRHSVDFFTFPSENLVKQRSKTARCVMLKKLSLTLLSVAMLAACGQQNTAEILSEDSQSGVIGGEKVEMGSRIMRSTVGLYDEGSGTLCTGTLISKELVLTAAHCVTPGSTHQLVFFTDDIKNMNAYNSRYAIKALRHEDYERNRGRKYDTADIALVRIRGEYIPVGYAPAPIFADFQSLKQGSEVVVAGYGLSWAWGVKKGSGALRTTKLKVGEARYGQNEVLIAQSVKKGVCSGDSGGPAYIDKNGELYLMGVTSRGDSMATPLTPKCFQFSIYSRVDAYLPWIKKTSELLLKDR
ncbi:serine protease [Bdellovibrio bacteriovorus]|uniref:Serine protease n=2 Tax=Bdellovibrio bacteriovorus TaxID=959 RepID=A0A1Z3NDB0_BDEBC|nr:serine protease [Bdellovibrio bacteriovorus]